MSDNQPATGLRDFTAAHLLQDLAEKQGQLESTVGGEMKLRVSYRRNENQLVMQVIAFTRTTYIAPLDEVLKATQNARGDTWGRFLRQIASDSCFGEILLAVTIENDGTILRHWDVHQSQRELMK